MTKNLTNELLQLQKSRCGIRYRDIINDFTDIPQRVSKTINRPVNSLSRNIAFLNRYQGIMLYHLEKRFYSSLRKLRSYKRKV